MSWKSKAAHIISVVCFLMLLTELLLGVVPPEDVKKMEDAMPQKAIVVPAQPRKMLVFGLCQGAVHGSIPYWNQALDMMGQKTGAFTVTHSTDMNVFNTESLQSYDAICFNNTTKLTPTVSQQKAIQEFITNGKGIVGIHAATDNFYEWPEGSMMMGGIFKGHPWQAGGTWAVKIDDPGHPLMKPFAGKGFKIKDEIYRTRPPQYSRANQRVLMSLDLSDPETKNVERVTPEDIDTGISWIKSVGKGRLFYCSLGHNNDLTWMPALLEHYLAGIQYALGDLQVDDKPLGDSAVSGTDKLDVLLEDLKKYDWSMSRDSLGQLDELIAEQYATPDVLKITESKLAKLLGLEISPAAKDFICRKLAVIGSDASVPALLKLLDEPKTVNSARYALEQIPSSMVDQGLLEKLQSVSDADTKIGIMTSLGARKCTDAVEAIGALAGSNDPRIADTAVAALGRIGSLKSVDILQKCPQNLQVQDALLRCADSLAAQDQSDDARAIYRNLYTKGDTSAIRAGALIGQIKAGHPELAIEAVGSSDAIVQAAAAQQAAGIRDTAVLQTLASQMNTYSDRVKIQLFAALAANQNKIGRPEIEQIALQTENKEVRIAAFGALMALGNSSTVDLLAQFAAKSSDREESEGARKALYGLAGEDVDAVILEKIRTASPAADEAVMAELIEATAGRWLTSACDLLFTTARDSRPKISSSSIRALQTLAGPDRMNDLVELLFEMPGSSTENAVAAVANKMEEPDKRAQALLGRYTPEVSDNIKVSMLKVLGRIGDRNAVGLLKKEFSSDNSVIHDAAFRAMTDWPGDDFFNEMKTLAQSSPDAKTKILAFRAYIQIVDTFTKRDPQWIVDELTTAYAMAERPDERKIVIGALGHHGDIRALAFVQGFLDDPALKAEAEAGLIQMSERLLSENPAQVKPVLQTIAEHTQNESLKKKADELLKKIPEQK